MLIDPFHKWLPSINSFEIIKISLTNLVFELMIQKNFYSQTRFERVIWMRTKLIKNWQPFITKRVYFFYGVKVCLRVLNFSVIGQYTYDWPFSNSLIIHQVKQGNHNREGGLDPLT